MLNAYLKIAWRNITRHRFYSLVNIAGLSVGIAFVLLIAAYAWQEIRVNRQLRNAGAQYIITSEWKDPNMGLQLTTIGPLAKALKENYPGLVRNYYRWDGITAAIAVGNKKFREPTQIGDSTLLTMYGLIASSGDVTTALDQPYSVVITEAKAQKYFGRTNVAGETLSIENFSGEKHDFTITAVLRDPGQNSVTRVNAANNNEIFLPVSAGAFFGRGQMEHWGNRYTVGYVELQPGASVEALENASAQLLKAQASPEISANLKAHFIPLQDYYLDADQGLLRKLLYILSAVALFILLMALINFVNISVSRSANRMKEIGVRKALGGVRRQLIVQFLAESTLLAFFASLLALGLYGLLSPYFAGMIGKELPRLSELSLPFALLYALAPLIIGTLAGIYPAFVLSGFRSPDLLRGRLKNISAKFKMRKLLVGFQFLAAAVVLIGGLIISEQVALFFSGDLGYKKELVVSLPAPRDWTPAGVQRMETVRNELAALPGVAQASLSYVIPNGNAGGSYSIFREGADSTQAIASLHLEVDKEYAATYGIPLRAGNFWANGERAEQVVINESAVKALGLGDAANAVGKKIFIQGNSAPFTICGVTNDFHFGTMKEPVRPVTFFNLRASNFYRFISLRLEPGDVQASLSAVQKKWAELLPGAVFEHTFMDETLNALYASELRLQKAAFAAIVLMMIVVLLGVLGLVSISLQQRTREIGIRKALGATVSGIVALFLEEMIPVILIALAAACPVAYLLMDHWLGDYAHRIAITPQPFIISAVILAALTMLLISLSTVKAALANPAKSIRTE